MLTYCKLDPQKYILLKFQSKIRIISRTCNRKCSFSECMRFQYQCILCLISFAFGIFFYGPKWNGYSWSDKIISCLPSHICTFLQVHVSPRIYWQELHIQHQRLWGPHLPEWCRLWGWVELLPLPVSSWLLRPLLWGGPSGPHALPLYQCVSGTWLQERGHLLPATRLKWICLQVRSRWESKWWGVII